LSTATIVPIPFLGDNYTYLLIDHATRQAAAIDPADPYTVFELAQKLRVVSLFQYFSIFSMGD
jgi:hydroxyacylglutathione hydrolase